MAFFSLSNVLANRIDSTTTITGTVNFTEIDPPKNWFVQGTTDNLKSGSTSGQIGQSTGSFNFSFTILNTLASSTVNVILKNTSSSITEDARINNIPITGSNIIPSTNWLTLAFGSDVKLSSGVLSGTVTVNRTSNFNSIYNNEPLILFVQTKVNGVVNDIFQFPFFIGTANTITKQISGNISYTYIDIEAYVFDSELNAYSVNVSKSLTDQSVNTIMPAPIQTNYEVIQPDKLKVNWTQPSTISSISGYLVQISYNNTSWIDIATIPSGSTSFIHSGFPLDKTVYSRIGVSYVGVSNYILSNVIKYSPVVTAPPTVPATPVLSIQTIDKTNYILSWTGNTTDLFNLERSTSTQNYSSIFGDLQDTDNQLNIALPDITETYNYRIRTKNSVGYSNYSNVITINITGTVIEQNILLRYNLDPPPPDGFISAVVGVMSEANANDVKNYVFANNLPVIKVLDQSTTDSINFNTAQEFKDRLTQMINQEFNIPKPTTDDYSFDFVVGSYKLIDNVNVLNLELSVTKINDEWSPLSPKMTISNSNSLGQKLETIRIIENPDMQVGGANIFPIAFNDSGFTTNQGMPVFIYVEVFLWYGLQAVAEPFVIKYTIDRPPVIPKQKPSILQKFMGFTTLLGALSLLTGKR